MATQPKKNSTKTSSKKKSISSKTGTAKKRVRKNKKSKSQNIFIFLGLLLILLLSGLMYLLGQESTKQFPKKIQIDKHYSTEDLLNDLAQIKVKEPKPIVKIVTKVAKKNKVKAPLIERGKIKKPRIDKKNKKHKSQKQNTALAYRAKKPKLVIIIDDVHTKAQVRAIKNLKMKITPSIFPPYALAKESNLLAKQLKHYMIHLPMESGNKQFNKQYKTLKTSFGKAQIEARVKEIRHLFPYAKYVNNHTGSVFTSDYLSMKILYVALKSEGFTFIDSFTVATSKVKKIAHAFGDAYVRRDIFIDNTHTVSYIHKQLQDAVKKAKKNGYAIAIGHPHKVTMKALVSAKEILKDVELVYIDDIYRK